MSDLHPEFEKLVLKLQRINKGLSYTPDGKSVEIDKIGQIIKDKNLINKCAASDFAKQLLIYNNVPEKYWINA